MNKELKKAIKLNEDRYEEMEERNQFAQNKAIDDFTLEVEKGIKTETMKQNCRECKGWNICGDPASNDNGDCSSFIRKRKKLFFNFMFYRCKRHKYNPMRFIFGDEYATNNVDKWTKQVNLDVKDIKNK